MYSNCLTSANEYKKNHDSKRLESYLAGIARGEKSALAALYGETKSAIYGFALSILKNPQDAEDVLQDTYIQVYKSAKTYIPQGKPMAYLITITRNLCLMKLRGSSKMTDISEENLERYFADKEGVTVEDRIVLITCMNELSEQEREIVMLFAVAGFKHREIAAMLDLPLATVLSKYNRAIKKLRTKIGGIRE